MSALSCIIWLLIRLGYLSAKKVRAQPGYFENAIFFRKLFKGFNIANDDSELNLVDIMEPVKADFSLKPLNVDTRIDKIINSSNEGIKFIVIDITLMGLSFPIDAILEKVRHLKKVVVIFYRSGLKLDQAGMEFCNSGIIECYLSLDLAPIHEHMRKELEDIRSSTGVGLKLYELNLIDNNIFFMDSNYSEDILNNTEELYRCFSNAFSDFKEIIVPEIYEDYDFRFHRFPYIVFKLPKEDETMYEMLIRNLKNKYDQKGINYNYRISFGFRNTSFHYTKNYADPPTYMFKISPGCFKGLNYREILHFLIKNNL